MKLFLLILGSFVISCNGMMYGGDTGESFLSLYTAIAVDKFREIMKTGNATLGIPVLDPFELDQYALEVKEEGLADIRGLLRNLKADGLANFTVIKADFSIIGVKVNLHLFWDTIKLFTEYSLKGTLASTLSVYGLGDVTANVRGLDVDVQLSLSVRDEKPYVRTFKSEIKLKELDLKVTGLFYDQEISKIVSTIVSDMVPQLIDDYQVELTTRVNTQEVPYITSEHKMARSIAIFAAILIFCQISAQASDLKPFLERFKLTMRTGNESLGLPVYDPYDSNEETLHVEISYVLADLLLNNLHMTGLSQYEVNKGYYSNGGLYMEMGFRWEEIVTKTAYDIDGTLLNKFPIYGKGELTGIIKGLDVTCQLDIHLGDTGLQVNNILSTVKLESLDFEATGLFNDEKRSKLLSKLISQQAPGMIEKFPTQAGKIMSEITEKKANKILGNLSVNDLLDLIKE
ncbi:hypothetical protein KPH14_011993 [Odynerus spinipes]|uniref:Uncharacterized protein n=1 Tax=Odynerus spinipes TaxID=1348599 RepID=A0AAD9RC73_9HYME|nr:hypothetical protein KPH14_011993 [Odynerus spinipes]